MRHDVEDLIAELVAERFGRGIPWRERTAKPITEHPEVGREDDLIKAQRRRDLNASMEDVDQRFRRGYRAA